VRKEKLVEFLLRTSAETKLCAIVIEKLNDFLRTLEDLKRKNRPGKLLLRK
jgi:hypothetical protein